MSVLVFHCCLFWVFSLCRTHGLACIICVFKPLRDNIDSNCKMNKADMFDEWPLSRQVASNICLFVVVLHPVISGLVQTCDSAHSWRLYSAAPLQNQAVSTGT